MRYQFTDQARDDLQGIAEYTLNTFGKRQAHRYLDNIEASCIALTLTPNKGRLRSDLLPNLSSIPCQSHPLYYVVSGDLLTIIRILHKNMDIANRLSD